jgi:hypothetical protein
MLKMVGPLSLSPGARSRDPLAQPTLRSDDGDWTDSPPVIPGHAVRRGPGIWK